MSALFPRGNNTNENNNQDKKHIRELGFKIDERKLEKEIERKIDTAMTRALKTINGK